MDYTLNPNAGTGDPYWYEWSVGLMYIIDMLNDENNIEYVTLQSSNVQGLDDVIVSYSKEAKECIQIKHTRVDDTLTFGDLITSEGGKKSLLNSMATAWKRGSEHWQEIKPILYTNRKAGVTSSKAKNSKGITYTRPPLEEFWSYLQKKLIGIENLQSIEMKKEWKLAWEEWCSQLVSISEDVEKLRFLKSLEIRVKEPGLIDIDEILIKKLRKIFGISDIKAKRVLDIFYAATKDWATTLRGDQEEITKELVYEKLSIKYQEMIGFHNLKPQWPFFPSREKFLNELSDNLCKKGCSIVYLTGAPGQGKTSIVTALSNQRRPVIDLRYHAFKPITPDSTTLPADIGKTASSRALWNDLLTQLRLLFKGRLAELEIPIFSEFLTTEELRDEVMRISEILGKERGTPTIIAIDGIDHAARSDIDEEIFLETLISPEEVPENVRFLIVGQPAEGYDKYPIWLKDPTEEVEVWEVEGIKLEDIELLLIQKDSSPEDQIEIAARIIDKIAQGNTLSAIFAVHESINCSDVNLLQNHLESRGLHNGLSTYYENIWNNAIERLQKQMPFIGDRVAACIALSRERLKGQDLCNILNTYNLPSAVWDDILRALQPLVVEENQGFRVLHNDVQVHLMRKIKGSPQRLREVASNMADYYLESPEKLLVRHNSLFKLLKLSNRFSDQSRAFTPEYVMEAISLGRPLSELYEQCKEAVMNVTQTNDWDCLISLFCACFTLKQFKKTADWSGGNYEFVNDLPPVLLNEGKVLNQSIWNLDIVNSVLQDASHLIKSNEINRAIGLMERWFSGLSPSNLLSILPQEDILNKWGNSIGLDGRVQEIFRIFGRTCQHTGKTWEHKQEIDNEILAKVTASFFGGYIEEAIEIGGKLRFINSLSDLEIFNWNDLESWLFKLAEQRKWTEVIYLLKGLDEKEDAPLSFQVRAIVFSILSANSQLVEKWLSTLNVIDFDILGNYQETHDDELPLLYSMMSFIIGWKEVQRESGGISDEGVKHYFENRRSKNGTQHLKVLLYSSAVLGKWFRTLNSKGKASVSEVIPISRIEVILEALLKNRHINESVGYGSQGITKILVELILEFASKSGDVYEKKSYDFIKEFCLGKFPVNFMLQIGWRLLANHGEYQVLEEWFDHWVGTEGIVWHQDVGERNKIIDEFAQLALTVGFNEKVEEVLLKKRWAMISYIGHKEYVLDDLIPWFKTLSSINPNTWEEEGIRMLQLSQEASKVGDNRVSIYIEDVFAEAVAKSGALNMYRFYHAQNISNKLSDNPHMLINGIIGLLETETPTEEELLVFLSLGIGVLKWQDEHDRCYLEDLKNAILLTAEKEGYSSLPQKIQKLGRAEFNLSGDKGIYRIPKRWFEYEEEQSTNSEWAKLKSELEMLSLQEAVEKLYHLYLKSDELYHGEIWKGVEFCCKRIQLEKPKGFDNLLEKLREIVVYKNIRWSSDTIYIAYSALLALYNEKEKWNLIHQMINQIEMENEYWIDTVADMLNHLCYYRSKITSVENVQKGLNAILNTHFLWINGNNYLPHMEVIDVPKITQVPPSMCWSEFAMHYLVNILNTDNGSNIEVALRGIWAIAQTNPEALNIIVNRWEVMERRSKEWVLLIAEQIASTIPESFDIISEIVKISYEGDELELKLQALIVYWALERSNGMKPPKWYYLKHPNHDLIKLVKSESGQRLLEIPAKKDGSIHTINGIRTVSQTLNFLEVAVNENLIDIEKKFTNYLKLLPSQNSRIKRAKKRNGEMQLLDVPEKKELMDILYYELFQSRWEDVPLIRLAEAILHGDEPYILLNTPNQANDIEDWLVDSQLDEYIKGNHKELEKRMLKNINAGVRDDELVLGAVMITYSHSNDAKITFHHVLRTPEDALAPRELGSTYNGRSFSLYHEERFDPFKENFILLPSVTYQSGGISNFTNQHFLCYPSFVWTDILEWSPSPTDPTIWLMNGRPVARLEYLHGPIRRLSQDRLYRQPIIQRWICNREVLEGILAKFGLLIIPRIEVEIN